MAIGISEEEARKQWAAKGNNMTGWNKNPDGSWSDSGSDTPGPAGYLENGLLDNGNNPLNADGGVSRLRGTGTATADAETDPIAASYARMATPPSDREAMRAQALRDVQSQLDAQTAFYAKQREIEQQRLAKAANLSASRVSALGLQRGLSGSSVVEGEKAQDTTLSAQEEALAMSKLAAEEANAKAGITGAATTAADTEYTAALERSQTAKLKQLDYLASLVPKAKDAPSPITVSKGQSVIDPTTGEVIYQSTDEDEGKTYTLAPGQTVVDSTGKVIYTAPAKEEAAKTYTVSPGQAVVDADGNVIYQSKPEDSGKTYTLSPGQTVVDAKGNVIYQAPSDKPSTFTLSPGQVAFDANGKVFASVPPSETQTKTFTLSPGQTVFGADGKPIAALPAAGGGSAPKTIETSEGTLQWNETKGAWEPVTLNGKTVVSAKDAEKTAEDERIAASAKAVAEEKVGLIDSIANNAKGMTGVVGPYGIARWTPFSIDAAEKQQFIADVEMLTNQETIKALIDIKSKGATLGAISDAELLLLSQSASKIGSWAIRDKKTGKVTGYQISEKLFKDELARMRGLAAKMLQPTPAATPDGSGGDELDSMLDQMGFNKLGSDSPNALRTLTIGKRNVRVTTPIALRLARAAKDFKAATGRDLQINQDFRTHEEQARLYKELSKKGARVAPPGHSFHEKGLAIDVTNWKEAEPFLRKYGLVNDLPDDRGHFSYGETNKVS